MARIEIDEGSGFCFGVTTAIKKAEEELQSGGTLYCRLRGDRVLLGGTAALYSVCELVMEGLT